MKQANWLTALMILGFLSLMSFGDEHRHGGGDHFQSPPVSEPIDPNSLVIVQPFQRKPDSTPQPPSVQKSPSDLRRITQARSQDGVVRVGRTGVSLIRNASVGRSVTSEQQAAMDGLAQQYRSNPGNASAVAQRFSRSVGHSPTLQGTSGSERAQALQASLGRFGVPSDASGLLIQFMRTNFVDVFGSGAGAEQTRTITTIQKPEDVVGASTGTLSEIAWGIPGVKEEIRTAAVRQLEERKNKPGVNTIASTMGQDKQRALAHKERLDELRGAEEKAKTSGDQAGAERAWSARADSIGTMLRGMSKEQREAAIQKAKGDPNDPFNRDLLRYWDEMNRPGSMANQNWQKQLAAEKKYMDFVSAAVEEKDGKLRVRDEGAAGKMASQYHYFDPREGAQFFVRQMGQGGERDLARNAFYALGKKQGDSGVRSLTFESLKKGQKQEFTYHISGNKEQIDAIMGDLQRRAGDGASLRVRQQASPQSEHIVADQGESGSWQVRTLVRREDEKLNLSVEAVKFAEHQAKVAAEKAKEKEKKPGASPSPGQPPAAKT